MNLPLRFRRLHSTLAVLELDHDVLEAWLWPRPLSRLGRTQLHVTARSRAEIYPVRNAFREGIGIERPGDRPWFFFPIGANSDARSILLGRSQAAGFRVTWEEREAWVL